MQPVEPVETVQPVEQVQPVQPMQPVRPVARDYDTGPGWGGWRAAHFIWTIYGIVAVLLLLRLVLKLLAANPGAGFSSFVYGITAPLVAPFQGVFGTPSANGSVLELASVLAIIVYALIAWALARLIEVASRNRTPYIA